MQNGNAIHDAPNRTIRRRLPQGADIQPGGGAHFRVWAPDRQRVRLHIAGSHAVDMTAEPNGYFSAFVSEAKAGDRYGYLLEDAADIRPDPMSRFQPDGPHGLSQLVDPDAYRWGEQDWTGIAKDDVVLYEMHIGTFTDKGTWESAAEQLPALKATGITCLEIMPVADFAGRFGWGYDGVDFFAPTRLYGGPDDMRLFIDQAHQLGIAVILDVVYNHFGPSGNYLGLFAKAYFTDRYDNEWGDAMNFDGPDSGPVRDYMISNARYWIDEYHLDGLRLDATQQIFDSSEPHILSQISQAVRQAASGRATFIVGENETQDVRQLLPIDEGGYGLDALWNDDLHHTATVALTGRREAYYLDYQGSPQEFVSSAKHGFLFSGHHYAWQGKRRGTNVFGVPSASFVAFLQNHDQIANSAHGWRIDRLTSPAVLRALTAYFLLIPATPMLFQGQEFKASARFCFFADHDVRLAEDVKLGRADFLSQFQSISESELSGDLPNPGSMDTFLCCKIDHREREQNECWWQLHHDLLELRRIDPVISERRSLSIDGAVLSSACFVLRFFSPEGDRLLLVNLGQDLIASSVPEPLLGAPTNAGWKLLWSSEDICYGGSGCPDIERAHGWHIPGHAATLLGAASSLPPSRPALDR